MVLAEILPVEAWFGIALFMFIIGLGVNIMYFLSGLGSHDSEFSDHDVGMDHHIGSGLDSGDISGMDVYGEMDVDIGLEHDVHGFEAGGIHDTGLSAGSVTDAGLDHDVSHGVSGDVSHVPGVFESTSVVVEGSRALMLSVIEAFFTMGSFGLLLFRGDVSDLKLVIVVVSGLIVGYGISRFFKSFTRGNINPVIGVQRGDKAVVLYGVTPEKPGLVLVTKRDGVKVKRTAIGTFPHDHFSAGENALVFEVTPSLLKITKGISPRPSSINDEKIQLKGKGGK